MYDWRNMTAPQRQEVVAFRKQMRCPPHSPPHFGGALALYHVSAANYEHRPIIGRTPERMKEWSELILGHLEQSTGDVLAWCVLPNHYHLLVKSPDIRSVCRALGKLHGRTSFRWNAEEGCRGRQCWCKCADRAMRSERHQRATVNYIHHNPVHHGYVERWQDWPFSSAGAWLECLGYKKASELWREYPILDYGKGWDDPGM
jgi:putative transposase